MQRNSERMPPTAIQDNLSSCRSSPMHWNPTPVPAPAFDGFPELTAAEENVSWEHCMRILNNSGRSFNRASGAAYPVFGSDRPLKRSGTGTLGRYLVQSPDNGAVCRNLSARLAEQVKVEEVAVTIRDGGGFRSGRFANSVSRATSPLPSEFSDFPSGSKDPSPQRTQEHHGSILKRIFGPLGQRPAHCFGSKQFTKKPAKSPQPRLSSVGLTGDADPRISSTNLATDAFDCEEELAARNMRRWLQYQQWTAMVAKAENNLTELSEMLHYAVTSLGNLKAMDEAAEEIQQKRACLYYAS